MLPDLSKHSYSATLCVTVDTSALYLQVSATVEPREVFSAHFTVCQKPWTCHGPRSKVCADWTRAWWARRADLERANGLVPFVEQPGRRCRSSNQPFCCGARPYRALPDTITVWPAWLPRGIVRANNHTLSP